MQTLGCPSLIVRPWLPASKSRPKVWHADLRRFRCTMLNHEYQGPLLFDNLLATLLLSYQYKAVEVVLNIHHSFDLDAIVITQWKQPTVTLEKYKNLGLLVLWCRELLFVYRYIWCRPFALVWCLELSHIRIHYRWGSMRWASHSADAKSQSVYWKLKVTNRWLTTTDSRGYCRNIFNILDVQYFRLLVTSIPLTIYRHHTI